MSKLFKLSMLLIIFMSAFATFACDGDGGCTCGNILSAYTKVTVSLKQKPLGKFYIFNYYSVGPVGSNISSIVKIKLSELHGLRFGVSSDSLSDNYIYYSPDGYSTSIFSLFGVDITHAQLLPGSSTVTLSCGSDACAHPQKTYDLGEYYSGTSPNYFVFQNINYHDIELTFTAINYNSINTSQIYYISSAKGILKDSSTWSSIPITQPESLDVDMDYLDYTITVPAVTPESPLAVSISSNLLTPTEGQLQIAPVTYSAGAFSYSTGAAWTTVKTVVNPPQLSESAYIFGKAPLAGATLTDGAYYTVRSYFTDGIYETCDPTETPSGTPAYQIYRFKNRKGLK